MSSQARHKLRALALMGAVTGTTILAAGTASAAATPRVCVDAVTRGGFDSRCDYELHPLSAPRPDIAPPRRPDPIPPYAS